MAGIDYTIPGQFKGIQLEPPENAMARAMQMRALQESSQMNALKQQEYLRGLENRNKLARIYADPKLISGSPEQLARIQQEVPDEYQSAVERALKGEDLKEKIAARKLSETKTQIDIDSQKAAQLKEAQREVTNFESIQDAIDHVNRKLAAGLIDQKHATYMLAQLPKNPLDFGKWKENTLMSMLTAEQQFTQRQKQQDDLYSEYVRSEVLKNPDAIILPKNEFLANIVKRTSTATATAPSDGGATNQLPGNVAFTSANAPNAGGQITVAEDGSKVMPPVEVTGLNLFEPAVANLLATRDSGNVELAKMMEKRLEEERKNKALTGGFLNVYNAEKIIADLEKQEQTPLVKRQIAALREAIKAENLGKGTNVRVNVPVSISTEKKYGEKFAGSIADADVALKDAAERAPETAANANRILSILQSGQVITGSAANVKLQLSKLLKLGGGSDSEAVTNTEVLISSLADSTLGAIKSSGLGSGQGFTDKDREFLERAKSGQITYEAASLKRLAELAHKASEATANKWNNRVKTIPKSAIEGTGISTEPITVPSIQGAKNRAIPALKNAKGWQLKIDANGNRAYVSPDGKQFEEVK